MGGGLFGTPLALNPKCLVFSAFVLAVYWLPHPKNYSHKIVVAFLLATLSLKIESKLTYFAIAYLMQLIRDVPPMTSMLDISLHDRSLLSKHI